MNRCTLLATGAVGAALLMALPGTSAAMFAREPVAVATATAVAASAPAASSAAVPASSLLPARVMKAARDRVAAGEYPMLVIGVVRDGKSRLYGFNAAGDPAPNENTVFELGSVTKTFTGLALAEAVKAGKLTLDEPVAKLLPGFKIPARGGKSITLGSLADQHSGLPRLPTNLKPANPADPYADYDAKRLKAFLAGYRLPRVPGSAFEYSNLGFGLLGYALARHAKTNYAGLIKNNILDPLGMDTCGVQISKTMRKNLASGHGATGKPAANWDFDVLAGAGGLKCSAADMMRYLKANMGAVKSPLHAAMELAHKPRADAVGANRAGLGWLSMNANGSEIVWHNGMTGGYASFIGFTADGSEGVFVLTDIARSVDDLGLATLVKGADLAPARAMISMSPAELDTYVGYYEFTPHFMLSVFRSDDQLYAEATGQGALPIYPSAKDEFYANEDDISLSFLRGDKGKIVGLVLHQHGDTPAKRVDAAAAAQIIGKVLLPLKTATLRDYVGRYKLGPDSVLDITLKHGRLYAQLTGQSPLPIYPEAKDRFFYILVKAELSFERDKSGKVIALVLHQGGKGQRAPRVKQ